MVGSSCSYAVSSCRLRRCARVSMVRRCAGPPQPRPSAFVQPGVNHLIGAHTTRVSAEARTSASDLVHDPSLADQGTSALQCRASSANSALH